MLVSHAATAIAPLGFEGPDFINAVTVFSTDQPVPALLAALREIELRLRPWPRTSSAGARAAWISICCCMTIGSRKVRATVCRGQICWLRAYMLGPLAELAPQRRYPPAGPTLEQLWQHFPRAEHPLEPRRARFECGLTAPPLPGNAAAPVHREHLAGHKRRLAQIPHRAGDVLG